MRENVRSKQQWSINFQKGDAITSGDKKYIVKELLGEGGQGAVYRVTEGRKSYALKVYKKQVSSVFRDNLQTLSR